MTDWFTTRDGLLGQVWRCLADGVADASAPARHPVLATIGLGGGPEARTVVLRAADRSAGTVQVHTDSASTKVVELAANPQAALHIWEAGVHLQIRLRGVVEVVQGSTTAALWSRVPDGSRASYGVTPAPGTPIATADAYQRTSDPARFAVLVLTIDQIDAVHLSGDYHRRALYSRHDEWHGAWLAP